MTIPSILYHYCSSETFVSLAQNKSIWLSSLTLSNDSLEGRLVNETVMRLAARDKLDLRSQEKLRESLEFIERFFDGLGFCLSEDGDLLSQWRGYADDAKGVALGFNRAYLETLSNSSLGQSSAGFALHKVEYEQVAQEALVEPTYRELRQLIAAGAFRPRGTFSLLDTRTPDEKETDDKRIGAAHRDLILRLLDFLPMLFRLKFDAFKEEKEWRLVSMLVGKRFEDCQFRALPGKVIPYRWFALQPLDVPILTEVVLGPRHQTPIEVIESLLVQAGLSGTAVRRSRASYR